MKKYKYIMTGLVLVILLIVGGVVLVIRPSPIPKTIHKQAVFGIFYPKPNEAIAIQEKSFRYDPTQKQVTFIVEFKNRKITFSEQSSPESFADDPSFYTKFLDKLGKYSAFDCVEGTVNLTRPNATGLQSAVMNAKGTLLFALADKDLSTDEWRQLFNRLSLQRP